MVDDVFGIVGSSIAGAYQVEAVVAEGGFAVVYRAQHTGFNAPVALKCLKLPARFSTERQQTFLQQFREEAELLFELSAGIPTIVRPLHVDALTTDDGTFVPYMVLEWLEGETLESIVAQRTSEGRAPLPVKKLVRLLSPAADALAKAHNFTGRRGSVSIVHCDIKPENIMVAKVAGEDVVKVLDFGVASAQNVASQVAGHAGGRETAKSFTPAFAAPEQWQPNNYGQTGPWTDVWGLALTMVEALVGRPVMDGDPATMMRAALDPMVRPTPQEHGVQVDNAVEAVFARALAVDPRQRPRDVGVFWDQLLAALGMQDERTRDLRREAGAVPREEVVEAALPPARRPPPRPTAKAPRPEDFAPPLPFTPVPPRPGAVARTRATVGTDEPFLDDDPGGDGDELDRGLDSIPPGLEAALPSIPPGADGFGQEAALPSLPPAAPEAPAAPPSAETAFDFDLELAPPAAEKRGAPEASLEASLRPQAKASPPEIRDKLEGLTDSSFGAEAALPSSPMAAAQPDAGGLEIEVRSRPPPAHSLDTEPRSEPRGLARPLPRHEFRGVPQTPPTSIPPNKGPGLALGVGLVVGAIVIGLGGSFYRSSTGEALAVGPVSATLVAGLVLAVGVGVIIFRLLPKDR